MGNIINNEFVNNLLIVILRHQIMLVSIGGNKPINMSMNYFLNMIYLFKQISKHKYLRKFDKIIKFIEYLWAN